jgi:endonuclease/exonuclease/phosphatase (EEP) superfamily protein YafD
MTRSRRPVERSERPRTPAILSAVPRSQTLRQRLLWIAALLWLAVLGLLLASFAFVGENAWLVVMLLYLPRHPWLVPGLLLLPFALRRGRRRLLVPLAVGALLWLFPLMGFVLPHPVASGSQPRLRVLSYNTTHTVDGVDSLRALARDTQADLVLFQWTSHDAEEALSGPGFEGWTVRRAEQFTLASRYSIRSLETAGVRAESGAPCAHAVLDTPLGPLDVFDIRPQSARYEIGAERHRGLRQRARELLADAWNGQSRERTLLREAQLRSIADEIAKATHAVLVAGDTNLPGGSLYLRRYFGDMGDAFVEAGWGFGYTHPARLPWMRLDRVLLGPGLHAVSFEVLGRRVSGHRPILADIVRQ